MQSNVKRNETDNIDASGIAIAILGWLAVEPEMLGRFLALTGTDPVSLRSAAADPGFLAGLLDFVMSHEPTLMAFCAATDTRAETVLAAWRQLSGSGLVSGEC